MVINKKKISKLIPIPWQNNKNTGFDGFPSTKGFNILSVYDKVNVSCQNYSLEKKNNV